jgi:hypothetical protein
MDILESPSSRVSCSPMESVYLTITSSLGLFDSSLRLTMASSKTCLSAARLQSRMFQTQRLPFIPFLPSCQIRTQTAAHAAGYASAVIDKFALRPQPTPPAMLVPSSTNSYSEASIQIYSPLAGTRRYSAFPSNVFVFVFWQEAFARCAAEWPKKKSVSVR